MNYYPHHIGDYLRDTSHLSLVEHGAYRRMLDLYYASEKPLPLNVEGLYRLVQAKSKQEKEAVDTILEEFFDRSEDGWRNARADTEIARAQEKSGKAKASAEQRWHTGRNANAMRTHSEGNAPNNQEPITNSQSKETSSLREEGPDGPPDCPHESLIALYHEVLPSCPRVVQWTEGRRGYMRSRWREKAKPNGTSAGYSTSEEGLAWWRNFFAYVGESKFLTGQQEGRQGRAPFVATLEWLLKPANFAKVIEGNYHR